MNAVQMTDVGGPLQRRVLPLPTLGETDVLVRIRAAGVCHTDEHYRAGTGSVAFLPITLGHEVAGVVDKAGPLVRSVAVGDRVVIASAAPTI
jgi:propanol-preferring alcohol dehydrogenase